MSQKKKMSEEPSAGSPGPLRALRAQIDELDRSLLALLEARVALSRGLGALKSSQGLPVRDLGREAEVLSRLIEHSQDEALSVHLPAIYASISACCLDAQGELSADPDELEELVDALGVELDHDLTSDDEPIETEATGLMELEEADELSLELVPIAERTGMLRRVARLRPRAASLSVEARAHLLGQPFAHRGFHSEELGLPENSLSAFEEALKRGYGVELDVHLSADGIPVVFHDEELHRMTGVEGRVDELTLSELKTLSLIANGERLPTLKEALQVIQGARPVLVEVKNYGQPVGPLEQAVAEVLDSYEGPFFIQSFNPMTLKWFLKHRPSFHRGLISWGFPVEEVQLNATTRYLLRNLMFSPICKPHYIAYEYQDLARFKLKRLHRMRKSGTPLLVWTVRSPEAAEISFLRADNIIFEGFDAQMPAQSDQSDQSGGEG